jgi:hypothetical protein
MFTNAKLALYVAAVLGSTSAAQTAPQRPTIRQTESIAQHQVSKSVSGDDSFAPAGAKHARERRILRPEPGAIQRIHLFRLGVAHSLDLETASAGRVQVSRFQRNTKCIGANYFIDRRRADAGPRAQNSGNPRNLGRHRNTNRR